VAFVKLYGSILDSSVWSEDPYTRILWITMLTMADAEGFVEAAVPGLARRANVPLEACEKSLSRLQAPDPYSKSPEHDGRRIEKAERGWTILNYKTYRELRTESQIGSAFRSKKYRERNSVTRHDRHAKYLSSPSVVSVSTLNVKEETAVVPHLPPPHPFDRAEGAINDEIHKLQLELGSRLARLAEHPKSDRMVPGWSKTVTAYERKDGTKVSGVSDFRMIRSIERLEKCIADADWWLAKLGPVEVSRGA